VPHTIQSTRSTSGLARALACALFLTCLSSTPAWCQVVYGPTRPQAPPQSILPPRPSKAIDLSGPRFGLTMLSPGTVNALKDRDLVLRPLISQFGFQFERRLYTSPTGMTALTEFVPLLSGLEQGVALPSLNWLVGVRSGSGAEFGIGPNITPVGVGLVVAAGVTIQQGALNIPLNFAVATSKSGARVSILTGFTIRR